MAACLGVAPIFLRSVKPLSQCCLPSISGDKKPETTVIPEPHVTRFISGSFGGLLFIPSVPGVGGRGHGSFSLSVLFLDHHFSGLLRQGISCVLCGLAVKMVTE